MIEGFLDEKRQNPSNKLDLAFFWSLVKEEGKDVCSMYQKLLIRLGIMEEEKEEIFHEQVRWKALLLADVSSYMYFKEKSLKLFLQFENEVFFEK